MRKLWILVLLVVVGDIFTTAYGLQHGETEGNPVLAESMSAIGVIETMVLFKSAACVIAYIAERRLSQSKWLPAATLAMVWGAATCANIVTLIT